MTQILLFLNLNKYYFKNYFLFFLFNIQINNFLKKEGDPASWTSTEQKLLEKALATYPSSDKERWDKIAAAVPGRTKKECIVRYKFLVEQLKASKK